MATQRGSFDPRFGGHDARLAQVLQSTESVTSSSFGALLAPSGRGLSKAKIYVTTLRLAAVPDDPRMLSVWSEPWAAIAGVRIKKSLVAATAFILVDGNERGVDTTKAMAGDIERAWVHMRHQRPMLESCRPEFLPSVDVRCSGCGSQIPPARARCRVCLRKVAWPEPLATLSEAIEQPGTLIPARFPDGEDTQRPRFLSGLAALTVGAICLDETDFVTQVSKLLSDITSKSATPPEAFGTLPNMRGVGQRDANERFWQLAVRIPQRLAG